MITSPRTNLKENWRKELEKWGFEPWTGDSWVTQKTNGRLINITIENIQTTYKWVNAEFDLIIADEIHTMMTPEYSRLFDGVDYEYLMGLTATHDITKKNDKQFYYDTYCPVIYEYYESADDGLINKTRFVIVNHRLDNDFEVVGGTKAKPFMIGEKAQYEYLTKRMKDGQAKMMAQGSSDWFNDAANWFWRNNGTKEQKFAGMMYLNAIKYRKEFLQKLTSTRAIAQKIVHGVLTHVPESKILVFSELTEQIDKITASTVHSHNKEEINQLRMDHFNEGKLRVLGSCQSLTLGLNLKGATHGIMESYVGSQTRSQQKKGRLDRLATNDVAEMWFIVVRDTQSEKWFESMSKGFDLTDAQTLHSSVILPSSGTLILI